MTNDVKFSKNVILIDVAFVNEVIAKSKKPMEEQLGRELPNIDLPAWLSYLEMCIRDSYGCCDNAVCFGRNIKFPEHSGKCFVK